MLRNPIRTHLTKNTRNHDISNENIIMSTVIRNNAYNFSHIPNLYLSFISFLLLFRIDYSISA